jgi:hypothetical protein
MAKKIMAVTGIRHNGDSFDAGTVLNPADFTREALKELHDNGAIVIVDDAKPEDVKAEDLTQEDLGQKGAQMMDVSAESKQATADQLNAAKNAGPETKVEAPVASAKSEGSPAKVAETPAKDAAPKK